MKYVILVQYPRSGFMPDVIGPFLTDEDAFSYGANLLQPDDDWQVVPLSSPQPATNPAFKE